MVVVLDCVMMWYLPTVGSIVRCYSDSYQHQLLLEQAENLGAVYDALNYVGSCPWRVNTKVCVGVHSECVGVWVYVVSVD